ncbi:tetratricopeptide repeat protein 33 [Limosa lapponica baueri]|uniref:Tetratricopeptide repeat protein 33 n=1 Tax=Limosa lapponica baueri TaxID=1758121 RepID=A0A2I0UCA0_LIMLA|nr:tetratricopeptide repeat protein 33 [Limosa lapponica baueri]
MDDVDDSPTTPEKLPGLERPTQHITTTSTKKKRGEAAFLSLPDLVSSFLGSGVECTLSKFEYDSKTSGTVDMLDGRDQRDRLEKGAHMNLMRFNKAKFEVLIMGWAIPDIYTAWVKN